MIKTKHNNFFEVYKKNVPLDKLYTTQQPALWVSASWCTICLHGAFLVHHSKLLCNAVVHTHIYTHTQTRPILHIYRFLVNLAVQIREGGETSLKFLKRDLFASLFCCTSGQSVLRAECLRGKEICGGGGGGCPTADTADQLHCSPSSTSYLEGGLTAVTADQLHCSPSSCLQWLQSDSPPPMQWGLTAVQVHVCSDCSQTPPPPMQSGLTAVQVHVCGDCSQTPSCQMQWGLTSVQVHVCCSDCSQTPPPDAVRPNCSPSSCLQWLQSDPPPPYPTWLQLSNLNI